MKTAVEPTSTVTIESTQEAISDRMARRLVLGVLKRFNRNPIQLHLPDGTSVMLGNPTDGGEIPQIYIRSNKLFPKVLLEGEIGFGEAYVEGLWQTDNLTLLLSHFINNLESLPGMSGSKASALAYNVLGKVNAFNHWRRRNTPGNSRRNIQAHYDLSNDFYSLWLDETMTYSSAWFEADESLPEAQDNKYRRLCERLQLRPGMRVLEIGCGWGGFACFAARNYGVHVTAVTISNEQFRFASDRVVHEQLQDRVSVQLCDYRDITGKFDAIASIEMLEAVGHEFLHAYFRKCHELLTASGRLGVQVILCPDSRYDSMRRSADWIKKHIFPGGQLPSVKALIDSACRTGDLYLHHLESFGLHYAKTLRLWRERFNEQADQVRSLGFDDAFVRKWNYYLSYCEAAFATRNINVGQLVLSRPNNLDFA